jgi:hypothetical protein
MWVGGWVAGWLGGAGGQGWIVLHRSQEAAPGLAKRSQRLHTLPRLIPLLSLHGAASASACRMAVFGLFPVLLGLGLTWLYAFVFTVSGVYDGASAETQVGRGAPGCSVHAHP